MDLTIEPTSVDTSSGPQTITVTAHITDDLAGLTGAGGFGDLQFYAPSTNQNWGVNFRNDNRISGTATDGFYQAQLQLPRYSLCGHWEAKYGILMSDALKNVQTIGKSQLSQRGLPTGFDNC